MNTKSVFTTDIIGNYRQYLSGSPVGLSADEVERRINKLLDNSNYEDDDELEVTVKAVKLHGDRHQRKLASYFHCAVPTPYSGDGMIRFFINGDGYPTYLEDEEGRWPQNDIISVLKSLVAAAERSVNAGSGVG